MRTVAIVQARMGSTRLPGKVLKPVAGKPMLEWVVQRLRQCARLDDIVVATTTSAEDDKIVMVAEKLAIACYRGSADDVLSRYVQAAEASRAEIVVRITADCPLITPEVTAVVVDGLLANRDAELACNVLHRTYPRGLDTEALHLDTLKKLDRLATSKASREHVTYFAYRERPELFSFCSITDSEDNSDLRWTVDTQEDLNMVRAMFEEFDLGATSLNYRELLEAVRSNPEISNLNAEIRQKEVTS